MDENDKTPGAGSVPPVAPQERRPVRLPNRRGTAMLVAATLAIGVVVGAAIGPAPSSSIAGNLPAIAQRLPLLLAGIAASHHRGATQATTAATEPPPVTAQPTPAAVSTAAPAAAGSTTTTTTSSSSSEGGGSESASSESTGKPAHKLPAVTTVWLIQMDGGTFEGALATPAAAPYITGQLLPQGTLLKGWSAIDASAFANEAALAEPPAPGATPPIVHSIVQPPCPEGTAGASCAPETPGQLTAADNFLKATLATITSTSQYKEHGLVVVTFASVGIPTQSELPAGSSTSQLSYQPPAGALLLSPFAKAGQRSSVAYDPTSPRRSLEALLH